MQADGFALGRHAEPARGAFEQALTKPGLERAKPLGDDGGHDIERGGCACEASLVAYGQHQLQIAAVHRQ